MKWCPDSSIANPRLSFRGLRTSGQEVAGETSSTLSDRRRGCLGGRWSEQRFQAGSRAEWSGVFEACVPSNAEASDNTDRKMQRRRIEKRESRGNPAAEQATGGAF